MCDIIRADLKSRYDATLSDEQAGVPPVKYALTSQQLATQLREFEKLIADIPTGFRLAPVLYSRITQDENAEIHTEYQFQTRPRFLRFLGENYADDLRALGICDHGIARMKNGLDPANAQGEMYDVNIDHITERAGSGLWGKSKAIDPDQPDAPATSHANHFGNFILLPKQVHEYKNKLNDMQHVTRTQATESMWTLMIIPERDSAHHGFVCRPQPQGHVYSGLHYRPNAPHNVINHATFAVSTVAEEIAQFKRTQGLSSVIDAFKTAAAKDGKTVSRAANDDARDNKQGGLRRAFNDAVAQHPQAQRDLDTLVRPGILDVCEQLNGIYEKVKRNRDNGKRGREAWERLSSLVHGANMRGLKDAAESLPLRESSQLYFTLRRLRADMRNIREEEKAKQAQAEKQATDGFNAARQKPEKNTPVPQHRKQGNNRRRFGK